MKTHFETLLEERELSEQIRDGIHEGLLGGVICRCLNANDELVLQRMWHLVAGEEHIGILQQLAMKGGRELY